MFIKNKSGTNRKKKLQIKSLIKQLHILRNDCFTRIFSHKNY